MDYEFDSIRIVPKGKQVAKLSLKILGEFVINPVKLIEGKNGLFLSFPSVPACAVCVL